MAYDADALDSHDDDWLIDDDGTVDRCPVDPSGPAVIYVDQTPRAYPEGQSRVAFRPLRHEPSPYLRGRGQAMPLRGRLSNARALDGFAALPQAGSEAASFGQDRLNPGEALARGQMIRSGNQAYRVPFQTDGNLVLYRPDNVALWDSGTAGRGAKAVMQTDGNLVIYDGNNAPVWASGTSGRPGAYFVIQDDGNLVIYIGSTPIWATNTVNGVMSHDMGGRSGLSKAFSSVTSAVGKVAAPVASIASRLVTSPAHLVSDIAHGKNVYASLKSEVKSQLALAKDVLPYAQAVLSMIPAVGPGINGAIAAGSALAHGQPISDALVAGVKGMVPGGPLAQEALQAAYNVARGQSLTDAAASALRSRVPGGAAAQAAFDTGLALAHGKNLQEAALGGVKTMASQLSPLASRALSGVGPAIGQAVPGGLVNLLSQGEKSVADALLHNPSLRSLPLADLAKRLNVPEHIARDGVASLVSSVARAGGSTLPRLAPARRLAQRLPARASFDQLMAQNASHASAVAFSPDMRRGRREVRWHKNANGRLAQVIMNSGASGFTDAGAISSVLQEGSKGADVLAWQVFLASAVGLDYSSGPGTFGPRTTAATKQFQASKGLQADGVVGPQTLAAAGLSAVTGASVPMPSAPPAPTPAVAATANAMPILQEGSKGAAVLTWQKFLASRVGLDYSTGPGMFGPRTKAATIQYQKSRGLLADGVVGAKTWASMTSAPPASPATAPPVTPSPGAVPAPTPAAATVATYLVTSRDTKGLSGIAQDFTGSAGRWKELAAANPQVRAPNYVIHAGDVLTLPTSWGASPRQPAAQPTPTPNIGAAIGDVVSKVPGIFGGGGETPVTMPPLVVTATPPMTPGVAKAPGSPEPAAPAMAGAGSGIALLGLIGAGLAASSMKIF